MMANAEMRVTVWRSVPRALMCLPRDTARLFVGFVALGVPMARAARMAWRASGWRVRVGSRTWTIRPSASEILAGPTGDYSG